MIGRRLRAWWDRRVSSRSRRGGRPGAPRRRPGVEGLEDRSLLSAGVLDTTFGGTGKILTSFGGFDTRASKVAYDQHGRILVAGQAFRWFDWDFAVGRYNPDDSLDTSFGS